VKSPVKTCLSSSALLLRSAAVVLCIMISAVPARAQLRELAVTPMEKPDGLVVQANSKFDADAMVLVYSSVPALQFRSSMDGIDQVTFRPEKNRYELLVKPIKQIIFAGGREFIEVRLETINPAPKEIFYFKVEEKAGTGSSRKGTVYVGSSPEGAQLTVNDIQTVYRTPYEILLPSGSARIGLQFPGYEPFDTVLQVRADERHSFTARLRANWAKMSVYGIPDDASVYIDNIYIGSGPQLIGEEQGDLLPGRRLVKITHPSYRTFERYITLEPGETLDLNPEMTAISGRLSVTSYPAGAEVLVDGYTFGRTPVTKSIATGRHDVVVRLADYKEEGRSVVVINGAEERLDLMLERTSTMELVLESQPSGAIVNIDGVYAGETPLIRKFDLADRAARGNRKITLSYPNHNSIEETLSFSPSAVPLRRNYVLTRKSGKYQITSSPERVQVFDGSTYLGTTPFTGTLPTGEYHLTFSLPEYKSDTATIRVAEFGIASANVALKRSKRLPFDILTFYAGRSVFRPIQDPGPALVSQASGDDLAGGGSGVDTYLTIMLGRNLGVTGMLQWSTNYPTAQSKTYYERFNALFGPVLSLPFSKNFKWEFRYLTGYSGMDVIPDRLSSIYLDQQTQYNLYRGQSNRMVESESSEKVYATNWRIGGHRTGVQLLLGAELHEFSHSFDDIGVTRNFRNLHYTFGLCFSAKGKSSK